MTTLINIKVTDPKSVKNYKYIGRGSKWGNPFSHKTTGTRAKYIVATRQDAVDQYKLWITEGDGRYLLKSLPELKDKTLGCFCDPLACHGHILIELINLLEKYS